MTAFEFEAVDRSWHILRADQVVSIEVDAVDPKDPDAPGLVSINGIVVDGYETHDEAVAAARAVARKVFGEVREIQFPEEPLGCDATTCGWSPMLRSDVADSVPSAFGLVH